MSDSHRAANLELVRRATDAYNARDKDSLLACYPAEMKVWTGIGPEDFITVTHDQHWETVEDLVTRLDLQETIEEMESMGDRVFVRFTYSATHRGEIRGRSPTGKSVEFEAWQLLTCREGLIVEERTLMDRLALFTGLGVVELPPP